jgi:hypothetical protein
MHATPTRQLLDPRIGAAAAAVAAAIFAAGLALGTLVTPVAPITAPAVAVPAGDGSYDAVEQTRADRGLAGPVVIQNYDALRKVHAQRGTD